MITRGPINKQTYNVFIFFNLLEYVLNYCCFLSFTGAHVQAARKEQKLALEEYYERHGKSGHH